MKRKSRKEKAKTVSASALARMGVCELILVELKTRRVNRPYLSDVTALSAQRLAVRTQTGEYVAGYGYVGDSAESKQAHDGASG